MTGSEIKEQSAHDLICTILGNLHNIESRARMIGKWHTSGNFDIEEYAKKIVEFRNEAFSCAVKVLEIAPSRCESREWIPVEKELPEKCGWYEITILDESWEKNKTSIGWFHGDDFYMTDKAECGKSPYFDRVDIIAWRPLPEPYQGD